MNFVLYQILAIILIHGLVFGVACYFIGAQKEIGPLASGLIGFVLGLVGLVVVLVLPRKQIIPFDIQLQYYKDMLDKGTIDEMEYNHLKGRLIQEQ